MREFLNSNAELNSVCCPSKFAALLNWKMHNAVQCMLLNNFALTAFRIQNSALCAALVNWLNAVLVNWQLQHCELLYSYRSRSYFYACIYAITYSFYIHIAAASLLFGWMYQLILLQANQTRTPCMVSIALYRGTIAITLRLIAIYVL